MPSNHLILCCPLLLLPLIFPRIRVFSNESPLRIRWSKCWSFSFSISPSNEHPGLISVTKGNFHLPEFAYWTVANYFMEVIKIFRKMLLILFLNTSYWYNQLKKVKVKSLSHSWFSSPMDCSLHQASPSTGFSRWEYWSGLPFPSLSKLHLKSYTSHFISKPSGRTEKIVKKWMTDDKKTSHQERSKPDNQQEWKIGCKCNCFPLDWNTKMQRWATISRQRKQI